MPRIIDWHYNPQTDRTYWKLSCGHYIIDCREVGAFMKLMRQKYRGKNVTFVECNKCEAHGKLLPDVLDSENGMPI